MKKFILLFLLLFSISIFKIDAAQYGSMAGIVDTNGSNLNVRSGPSTSHSIITKLKDNSYVTMISTHNDFYYIEYQENKFGYVHKTYIDALSGDARKVNTDGSNLNVRKGPSTNYEIIDKITYLRIVDDVIAEYYGLQVCIGECVCFGKGILGCG